MDVEEDAPDAALSGREPDVDDGYEETLPEDFEEADETELAELLSKKAAYQAAENPVAEIPVETDDEPVETVVEAPQEALDETETGNSDVIEEETETITQETFVLAADDVGQNDESVSTEKPDVNAGNETDGSTPITEVDTSAVEDNKAETADREPPAAAPAPIKTEEAAPASEEFSATEDEQPIESQAELEEQPQAADAAEPETDAASQPEETKHGGEGHPVVSMKELAGKLQVKPGKTLPLPPKANGQETPNRMTSLLNKKQDS